MSEDLDAPVNLKLSDYGISKYCWSGGTVGLVGTPGYQAPEILDGLPYDEKVCHCSVSIHVLVVAGLSLDCALYLCHWWASNALGPFCKSSRPSPHQRHCICTFLIDW